ncbi:MAG: hypothetical protein R3C40_01590 [Parvularculaceae bacterium]
MPVNEFLASVGLGGLKEADVMLVQMGILAVTVILLVLALTFVGMAFRASGRADRALAVTKNHLRTIQDLTVEVRQLSAQTERTASKRYAATRAEPTDVIAPLRVGARETTPEADVLILEDADQAVDGNSRRNLEAARESATVPRSLLTGLVRRR